MNENGQKIINNEVNGIQRTNVDLTQGIMKVSTTPAETTVEMVNENRNIIDSGNINNQNLNDGNVSKLMEQHNALVTKESFLCRICYNYDQRDRFISPCLCKGSLGNVHRNCLEHWLASAGILHCELCMYRFRTECTLRYSCCEAIRLWYSHPNHRGLIQSDVMLCSTLTLIVLGLLTIVCFGLDYFVPEGHGNGLSEQWMKGTTIVLLVVSILAYIIFTTFMIRQQLYPWYRLFLSALFRKRKENNDNTRHITKRWWRSSRIVRVILPKTL